MNLYQHHLRLDNSVVKRSNSELGDFIRFLKQARELLAELTDEVPLKRIEHFLEEDQEESIEQETYTYQVLFDAVPPKKKRGLYEQLFRGSMPRLFEERPTRNGKKELALKPIERDSEGESLTFDQEITGKSLFIDPNTYALDQQISALRQLKDRPNHRHRALLSLFERYGEDSVFGAVKEQEEVREWLILKDGQRDGTEEQRNFVSQAINTPEFAWLEGPPGSGKTTAIIELVLQLAMRGKRVLLCSATHVAIDNVFERILTRYKDVAQAHIVPVRIASNADQIREESVKAFHLTRLAATYKQEILGFLKRQKPSSEAQKYLRKNLDAHREDGIQRLILDSANLVGGTTIGILQHPDLKSKTSSVEPFDYLIIDEASKVPFQEFLVPALHAKRWILVGDVHQLSPYVEDSYVAHALKNSLPVEEQTTCYELFPVRKKLAWDYYNRVMVLFTDQPTDLVQKQLKALRADDVVIALDRTWKPSPENVLKLQTADVLICPDQSTCHRWMEQHLFVEAFFFHAERKGKPFFQSAIQNRFHAKVNRKRGKKKQRNPRYTSTIDKEGNWPNRLASKLNQKFSFRDDEALSEGIQQEIEFLLPSPETKEKVQEISRIVFPSILEMLQRGVEKSAYQRGDLKTIFTDGMPKQAAKGRFTSLSYQHRMHPDIPEISSEHFYQGDNLKAANSVNPDRAEREWQYRMDRKRVFWIAHEKRSKPQHRIINQQEVSDIQVELDSFMTFAKDHPVPRAWGRASSKYEVAVLTFYRDQEIELRKMLQRLSGQRGRSRNFDLGHRIALRLNTVDQFQGQEADMVLLSFTKYTRGAHYHSPNRLNVALTRARHQLILFGNRKWMAEKAKLPALRALGELDSLKKT